MEMPDLLSQQMIRSATEGDLAKVSDCLGCGADIHAKDDEALRRAAEKGHANTVALLLQRGADPKAFGVLRWAAYHGHTDVVRILLDYKADIHVDDDQPLRWAAAENRLSTVGLLIDCGANVRAKDDEALRRAAYRGHQQMVDLLLAQTFRPDIWWECSREEIEHEGQRLIASITTHDEFFFSRLTIVSSRRAQYMIDSINRHVDLAASHALRPGHRLRQVLTPAGGPAR